MSKRVLVVDDERRIADTLAAILCHSGYQAAVAYDPQCALQQCESFAPDVVVSDVVMPGMNGVEMAMRIQARHPGCKILLTSGMASAADLLVEARRRGHNFLFLLKPVAVSELLGNVEVETCRSQA